MSKTIETIDVASRLSDGVGRIVIIPGVDPTRFSQKTQLKDIFVSILKDMGAIVEGSFNWDGDEGEIEVLKSTEGGVIRSKVTDGTFAYSCRIPHSVQTAKLAGAKVHTVTDLGGNLALADEEEVLGLNPRSMKLRCPVVKFDLTHKELQLFPKATVIFSPTSDDDDLSEYNVKVQAESIETKHLSTMMFIPLDSDPFEDTDDDEEEDNEP
ncbi:MAG: hypothetical protein HDS14_00505 [Bacteroides sp.]|nr:hypothetical protein [Bacteroides sp.]